MHDIILSKCQILNLLAYRKNPNALMWYSSGCLAMLFKCNICNNYISLIDEHGEQHLKDSKLKLFI